MLHYPPTPHNEAQLSEFSKKVLLVGDPKRSEYIAKNFLKNAHLINNVRGVQGYTGEYNGKLVSVMAHGMGNPSMGIYSYELFKFYDVDTIIRAGSIGATKKDINLGDIIVSERVYTDTNYDNFLDNHKDESINASKELIEKAKKISKELNEDVLFGNTYCCDTLYNDNDNLDIAKKFDIIGEEMENASLYLNAKKFNKEALSVCTVSNSKFFEEELSSSQRENGFKRMILFALNLL